MEEIINDFLIETAEILEDLDQKFIKLEGDRENQELLDAIFRSVHTIKGASGFLGFNQMVELTHDTENVLKKLRDGILSPTPHIMDTILESADVTKVLLDHIKAKDGVEEDLSGVISKLRDIHNGNIQEDDTVAKEEMSAQLVSPIEEKKLGELLVEKGTVSEENVEEALKIQAMIKESIVDDETPKVGEILSATGKVTEEEVEKTLSIQGKPPEREKVIKEQTIRVDVARLDNVLNLIGELVLGRNRLMKIGSNLEQKYPDNTDIGELSEGNAFINLITTDLQLAVMKTRMQPVKKVFNKFPRMVRDLARAMGKEVELRLSGEETELDKSIIEEIGDPLVHLIRNAIDHGIESPEVREKLMKPRQGNTLLSAYQEGNNICLSIEDDGKGMDHERLRQKIAAKGLIPPEDVEKLSEKEILDFIFLPGFSTAQKVSDISGRGVGMDVVKTNISKLNGTIHVVTEKGSGTKFLIKLPLTLAIIQALMVGVGSETFALPLSSVVEIVRVNTSEIKKASGQETILLRDEVLPVLRLARKFNIDAPSSNGSDKVYMVAISAGENKFGLFVDRLYGQEEVVIKQMEGSVDLPEDVAGATITGDGKVVLILDPAVMLGSLLQSRVSHGT